MVKFTVHIPVSKDLSKGRERHWDPLPNWAIARGVIEMLANLL